MQRRNRQQSKNQQQSLTRILASALIGLGAFLLAGVGPVGAVQSDEHLVQSTGASEDKVRVVELNGLLDPVMYDFLIKELDRAEQEEILAVVLLINSNGSILDDERFVDLATRLRDSPLFIAMWVGPTGSAALGGTAELLVTADLIGVPQGSWIGDIGTPRLSQEEFPASFEGYERLLDFRVRDEEAVDLGISAGPLNNISTLRPFLSYIDGFEVQSTAEGTQSITATEFVTLPLSAQLFHTVASPEVAYLFLILGLGILIFELYTAGVGVAGVIGVFLLVLGSYGIAALPARNWAVALILAAFVAIAVDIQTNIPRFYSIVGVVFFTVGSWFLYEGLRMSIVTTGFGIIGILLYVYTGMPSMVRTRFSTPTIGRRWMIGSQAIASTDVNPEGTVEVDGTPWRALTNRATPIKAGDPVVVVGISRLLLEIAPVEGGAKDYRQRS